MLGKLALLFILFPLTELAILIYLGTLIGTLNTIVIVVLTGLAGALLARHQGLLVLYQMRASLQQGITPADQLMVGFLIFTGGLLLVSPGIITDVAGIFLLVPAGRRLVLRWLRKFLERKISQGQMTYYRLR